MFPSCGSNNLKFAFLLFLSPLIFVLSSSEAVTSNTPLPFSFKTRISTFFDGVYDAGIPRKSISLEKFNLSLILI